MTRHSIILFALFAYAAVARADLVLVQQTSDTNFTEAITLKIHGNLMRMDEGGRYSVVVDLASHDSVTLLTNKTYMKRSGAQILHSLELEKEAHGGTNDVDMPPAAIVATGKSEAVNGLKADIYTWSGARGLEETLWVVKNFPNCDAIKTELAKLDQFNDSGPHRNAQPLMAKIPGMVVKTESILHGQKSTTTLVSVNLQPVPASLFELPAEYKHWEAPAPKKP